MILQISNKQKIIEDIGTSQSQKIALIYIDSPYPDPLDFSPVIGSNRIVAVLKLFFYDGDQQTMNDSRFVFNTGMRDSAVHFIEAMLALDVDTSIIFCEKGLHRSVALCKGLHQIFSRRGVELKIANYPEKAEPNPWVLKFFEAASDEN